MIQQKFLGYEFKNIDLEIRSNGKRTDTTKINFENMILFMILLPLLHVFSHEAIPNLRGIFDRSTIKLFVCKKNSAVH